MNPAPDRPPTRRGGAGAVALKLLISAAAVALAWRLASPGEAALRALAAADPWRLAAAVSVFIAGQVAGAARLRYVLARLNRRVTLATAIRAFFIGLWFNQVLPTGIGGDVVKVLLLRRPNDTRRIARAILVARAVGLIALLAATVLLAPFYGPNLPKPERFALLAAVCAALLAGLAAVVALSRRVTPLLPGSLRPLRFGLLVLRDLSRIARPACWFEQAWTSTAVVLSVVFCFFWIARALGFNMPWRVCLVLVPPVIMSMHVPLSWGGWGIREIGAVALLPLGGVPPETALLISILYGFVILCAAVPGLLLWQAGRRDRTARLSTHAKARAASR
jgi:uncharacterized membrane protein YbhN (UPF0104 family)